MDLDDPSGSFDDAPESRDQHLSENDGLDGTTEGSLSAPQVGPDDAGVDLQEPAGGEDRVEQGGHSADHAAGSPDKAADQPDTYE